MGDFDTGELAILHALVISERDFKDEIGERDEEFKKLLTLEKRLKEMIIPPNIDHEPDCACELCK